MQAKEKRFGETESFFAYLCNRYAFFWAAPGAFFRLLSTLLRIPKPSLFHALCTRAMHFLKASRGEEKIVQNKQTEPTQWGAPKAYKGTSSGEVCL